MSEYSSKNIISGEVACQKFRGDKINGLIDSVDVTIKNKIMPPLMSGLATHAKILALDGIWNNDITRFPDNQKTCDTVDRLLKIPPQQPSSSSSQAKQDTISQPFKESSALILELKTRGLWSAVPAGLRGRLEDFNNRMKEVADAFGTTPSSPKSLGPEFQQQLQCSVGRLNQAVLATQGGSSYGPPAAGTFPFSLRVRGSTMPQFARQDSQLGVSVGDMNTNIQSCKSLDSQLGVDSAKVLGNIQNPVAKAHAQMSLAIVESAAMMEKLRKQGFGEDSKELKLLTAQNTALKELEKILPQSK